MFLDRKVKFLNQEVKFLDRTVRFLDKTVNLDIKIVIFFTKVYKYQSYRILKNFYCSFLRANHWSVRERLSDERT